MRRRGLSRGAASVVVIGVDQHGMGLIRECLGTEAVLPTNSTPYEDALPVVQKNRPNVVIMGFDSDFDEAVRLGPLLTMEVPGLQMVATSERTDPERIRAAMRAGYREYVVLPEDADLLRKAVHESAYASSSEDEQGQVIAMMGAKGGVGVSFLTIQLAAELCPVHRVCAVDLDFSSGDLAAFLDLNVATSFQDVMSNLHRLDERVLAGSVIVHPSKVHVLAQPTEVGTTAEEMHADDIIQVLTATADAYQYVLLDCGNRLDVATLTATSVADMVVLVCTPDVVSVKDAWRRLELLKRMGIDRDSVRLIVNRWDRNGQLTIKDIETNLDATVAATISVDAAGCLKAVNVGRLLRDVDKRSPAVSDISAAVELITEGVDRVTTNASGRSFWGLFG